VVDVPVSVPKQPATLTPANPLGLRKLLSQAFATAPQDADKWISLGILGHTLHQLQPDFQSNTYGHSTLTKLLQSMPDFVEFQTNGNATSVRLKNKVTSKQPDLNKLRQLLLQAFAKAPQDSNGWTTLSTLGNTLPQVKSGFKTNSYGHSTLSKLLESMPDFVDLRGKGAQASARLKK
jgi:hypothetical protein